MLSTKRVSVMICILIVLISVPGCVRMSEPEPATIDFSKGDLEPQPSTPPEANVIQLRAEEYSRKDCDAAIEVKESGGLVTVHIEQEPGKNPITLTLTRDDYCQQFENEGYLFFADPLTGAVYTLSKVGKIYEIRLSDDDTSDNLNIVGDYIPVIYRNELLPRHDGGFTLSKIKYGS